MNSLLRVQSTKKYELAMPNGVIASLDGKTLYVSDSHGKEWRRFDILADGRLDQGEVFYKPATQNTDAPGAPDGMTIDELGNIYCTALGGVWVVIPKAEVLGFIPVLEFCSNVAFDGIEYNELFIACSKKVYRLDMNVCGVR